MESGGPKRVILDEFTITVSPTAYGLTMVQAGQVVDVAEELVEACFETFDWGDSTLYQYMGFTTIESVSFYDQSYSVIRVKGGIVSFDGTSQSIPTHVDIQAMIQEQLDPSERGETGLTQALQATEDFSYVTETIYDILWEPTPAPSTTIQTTIAPVSSSPTAGPTVSTPLFAKPTVPAPSIPKVGAPANDSNNNSESNSILPMIVGIVAGLVLASSLAVLFVYRRKRKQRTVWHKTANHLHPQDDDLELGAKNEGMSEAGSSRLGRLLTAAVGGTTARIPDSGETATPPQSSSEESSDDDLSSFDGEGVSVEPIIIPIDADDYVDVDTVDADTKGSADLESGIAELVAMQQVATVQEQKVAKEPPNVVVEEGILFVESGAEVIDEQVCTKSAVVPVETNDSERVIGTGCGVPPCAQDEGETEDTVEDVQFETEAVFTEVHDAAVPLVEDVDSSAADEAQEVVDVEMQLDKEPRAIIPLPLPPCDVIDKKENGGSNKMEEEVYADQDCDLMAIVATGNDTDQEVLDETVEMLDGRMDQNMDVATATDGPVHREEKGIDLVGSDTESSSEPKEEEPSPQALGSDFVEDIQVQVGTEQDLDAGVVAELISNLEEEIVDSEPDVVELPVITPDLAFLEPSAEPKPQLYSPYSRWSDVSSDHSREPSVSDDDQQEFKPDESWDFNDNDEEESEIFDDPFQTPSTLPSNDMRPLLRHAFSFCKEKQGASDKTVDSDPCSTTVEGSESDATFNDPFQTSNRAATSDEKPLLSKLLGTYKLDKVATNDDSEKRRRSRSAPPTTKRRTVQLC